MLKIWKAILQVVYGADVENFAPISRPEYPAVLEPKLSGTIQKSFRF
jgi:hypothetical protein